MNDDHLMEAQMDFRIQRFMHMNNIKNVKPSFCDEQTDDIQQMFDLADNMASAATSMTTNGSQGYQSFVEAREAFRSYVLSTARKYRIVEIGDFDDR